MYTNKLKNDQSWRIVNDCFHKKNQNNKYKIVQLDLRFNDCFHKKNQNNSMYKIVQLDLRYLTLAKDCTATKYWPHKD